MTFFDIINQNINKSEFYRIHLLGVLNESKLFLSLYAKTSCISNVD